MNNYYLLSTEGVWSYEHSADFITVDGVFRCFNGQLQSITSHGWFHSSKSYEAKRFDDTLSFLDAVDNTPFNDLVMRYFCDHL